MAYYDSNAAYAYDFEAAPDLQAQPRVAPRTAPGARPHFDVYTGEGREANQVVSPVFTHVVKVFCALVAIFFAIGLARVAIAGVTAAELNANAALTSSLEEAQDESSSLEVMNSVYGADTRIRDLATGTLGMVEPEDTTVLDLSQDAKAQGASADADAQGAGTDADAAAADGR